MNTFNLKKNYKFIRNFAYLNVHSIPSDISQITCFYTKPEHTSLKFLIKISTFLELITNQRAIFIRSKQSIAVRKIRKGMPIGAKVTLRKRKLTSFLTRLI